MIFRACFFLSILAAWSPSFADGAQSSRNSALSVLEVNDFEFFHWAESEEPLKQSINEPTPEAKIANAIRVKGADPYLILPFHHEVLQYDADTHSLNLGLLLRTQSVANNTARLELFFRDTSIRDNFDSHHRLSYLLKDDLTHPLVLPLPNEIQFSDSFELRLDLDGCRSCVLVEQTLADADSITQTGTSPESPGRAILVRSRNGLSAVPRSGIQVPLQGWKTNDIALESNTDSLSFRIEGGDPFLVSPFLDVDTAELGGILLSLQPAALMPPALMPASNTADATPEILDLQIFYATEKHRFVEAASTIVRAQIYPEDSDVLIPLEFLATEFPPNQILEQLRIDIASHSVLSSAQAQTKRWQLNAVTLLHKEGLNEAKSGASGTRATARQLNIKQQKQNKSQVLSGVLTKIFQDMKFIVLYALMLLGILVFLIRNYRRA